MGFLVLWSYDLTGLHCGYNGNGDTIPFLGFQELRSSVANTSVCSTS